MRMMARFTIPVESGNELVRSGKLNQSFERLMEDLKPEAAYFFPDSTGVSVRCDFLRYGRKQPDRYHR